MISWVRSIRECVTNQVEGNCDNGYDYCWDNQQLRVIQEVCTCISQQNTQRRCVDIKTKTEVRQHGFHVDGTRDGQSQTQDDNADQLRQDVLHQNAVDWGTQSSGSEVELTVTVHHNQISNVSCHNKPSETDQGYTHDEEALANQKSNQGHVDNHWNVVDDVVQLGEEAVQLTDVTPDTTDGDTQRTFTQCNDQSQLDGGLGCVPNLAPVVTANVVGTEPVLTVWRDKCLGAVGYQRCIVIFSD